MNQKFALPIVETTLPLIVVGCRPVGEPTPVTREMTLPIERLVGLVKSASSAVATMKVEKLSNRLAPLR